MIDCNRPYLQTGKVEEDRVAITLTVDRVETIQCYYHIQKTFIP
jgi:hypothetical protein